MIRHTATKQTLVDFEPKATHVVAFTKLEHQSRRVVRYVQLLENGCQERSDGVNVSIRPNLDLRL